MQRIFNNSSASVFGGLTEIATSREEDVEGYVYKIHALIEDADDYEKSELSPSREEHQRFYNGLEPVLPVDEDEEDGESQQSTVVSTDVRDTVLAIIPAMMRTFAASEHCVNFMPRNSREIELAQHQTDYIRYKFWDENAGFMTLYSAIKDCLTVRLGVVTWWTDNSMEVKERSFQNVSLEAIAMTIEQSAHMGPEIVDMGQPDQNGNVDYVTIRYNKSVPSLKVEAIPPEEFRISRNAKSVQSADLVGWERMVRASEVVARGFDVELVRQYVGETAGYAEERNLRNPGADTSTGLNDMVLFGEFTVRVDEDGDGINELHRITTLGGTHDIVDDYIVPRANYALFQSDPRPHTAIGDSPASLVMEIQKIKTNILRGSLDSLADNLNPRIGINEMVTEVDDALAPGRGGIIRTRGNPSEAIFPLTSQFVGMNGIEMLGYFDGVRQSRTGITEMSKGLDPKVFQSTNDQGIDFVVNGAQERIELIARIIAETGIRDLYIGMLSEVTDNPNEEEEIMVRGEFVVVQPSLFDAGMRCIVNPTLGKGSDTIRLQALEKVLGFQERAIEKFGIGNGVVGIGEISNTIEDILTLINIKDTTRYFREITPEQIEAIETAPKEPDAAELLAKAELEKVKKDMVVATATLDQKDVQIRMDDDFRRDKLNVESYVDLIEILADIQATDQKHIELRQMNEVG